MSVNRHLHLVAVPLLALAGCGGDSATSPEAADEAARDDRNTVLTDAVNAPLDRAKAIEDVGKQRKAEMDARLAEMEGETDADEP